MRSNTSGAEHFSSLSHQISMTSNLNSLGEKHTPHYASVAVASFAKNKINGPLPNSTTPLYEPIGKSQTGFKTKQKFALIQSSPLPKSSSPHPKTERFSMAGLRYKRVVCFHANAIIIIIIRQLEHVHIHMETQSSSTCSASLSTSRYKPLNTFRDAHIHFPYI